MLDKYHKHLRPTKIEFVISSFQNICTPSIRENSILNLGIYVFFLLLKEALKFIPPTPSTLESTCRVVWYIHIYWFINFKWSSQIHSKSKHTPKNISQMGYRYFQCLVTDYTKHCPLDKFVPLASVNFHHHRQCLDFYWN